MLRRPPRSTLFPTRRSSDLPAAVECFRRFPECARSGHAVARDFDRHAKPGFVHVARDRKSTRLNSSHVEISYAVFCLKKKKTHSVHPPAEHLLFFFLPLSYG